MNKNADERRQEERLSLAHARQQSALESIGLAAVVTVQIFNRWPQASQYLKKLDALHAEVLSRIDEAQQLIQSELDANRQRHSG